MDRASFVAAAFIGFCLTNMLWGMFGETLNSTPRELVAAWKVTESTSQAQCSNPDCPCKNCECDPCECPLRQSESTHNDAKTTQSHKPIIYFFTRADCIYCPPMKQLANQLHRDGHKVYVVDETRQDLVSKYGVDRYPTFLVVDGEKQVRRVVGLTTKDAVLGTEPALQSMPIMQAKQVQLYKPQRSGWFRARSSNPRSLQVLRSVRACGPGGCR